MMRRLTQPPTTLNCNDYPVTYGIAIITVLGQGASSPLLWFPPLSTIKTPLKQNSGTQYKRVSTSSPFPGKVSIYFVPNLSFGECVRTTRPDIFYAGKKLAQSLVVGLELLVPQSREKTDLN